MEFFRDDKGTRPHHGGDNVNTNRTQSNTLQVTGPNLTEEVLKRRLAAFEPFSMAPEPDDDK